MSGLAMKERKMGGGEEREREGGGGGGMIFKIKNKIKLIFNIDY